MPDDLIAPRLTNLRLPGAGGVFSQISVEASDEGSGVRYAVLDIRNREGFPSTYTFGTNENGFGNGDSFEDGRSVFTMPARSAYDPDFSGVYSLHSVRLVDFAGNSVGYEADYLRQLGYQTEFVLQPQSVSVSVTGGTVVREGDGPANLQLTFAPSLFITSSITVGVGGGTASPADTAGPYPSFSFSRNVPAASPYTVDLPINIVDDALVEGTETLTVLITAPGHRFANGWNSTFVTLTILDDDIGGTANADVMRGTSARDSLYGLGGDDLIFGLDGNDYLDGGAGNDRLFGGNGNDTFVGGGGVDRMFGGAGNDTFNVGDGSAFLFGGSGDDTLNGGYLASTLYGGAGNDRIAGNSPSDVLGLSGSLRDYAIYRQSDVSWRVMGRDGVDTVSGIEFVRLDGRDYSWAEFSARGVDGLRYIASNVDLIQAFGTNAAAGTQHFLTNGLAEGRNAASFNALRYAAANPDVAAAFGTNETALTTHYITQGFREGRATDRVDALGYAARNPDVAAAFGLNEDALLTHYILSGRTEGRSFAFDAAEYGAANPDLLQVFGDDRDLLTSHYIGAGRAEGRATDFNEFRYAASNRDVALALGTNSAALTQHFLDYGYGEGRSTTSFNPLIYAASNADVARAFGTNTTALYDHYLNFGARENRPTNYFSPEAYAAANPDVRAAYGSNADLLTTHYIQFGRSEGRPTAPLFEVRVADAQSAEAQTSLNVAAFVAEELDRMQLAA